MQIEIRLIETFAEYLACEDLQRLVWGADEAVPQHLLLTLQRSGGLVLGAFDLAAPGAPLVGFVFGFLGRAADGRPKHASHMAAVLPAYRDARVGERLKLAQREHVLAQGVELITWTFDPLISRNARLNLRKLGAVCRTYLRNLYGPEPEPADDLPSDRFQVDWWVGREHVAARLAGAQPAPDPRDLRAALPLLNPDPRAPAAPPAGERLLIQIPAEIEALKAADLEEARAWRLSVRAAAEAAFAAGYHAVDYVRDGERGLYLLERGAFLL